MPVAPASSPWTLLRRVALVAAGLVAALATGAGAQTVTTVEHAAVEHGDEAVAVWWLFVAAFVVGAAVIALRARRARAGR